jgi:hypothetical protein
MGKAATADGLRTLLGNEVSNLPRYSVFIFYFAGHGTRQIVANPRTFLMLDEGGQAGDKLMPTNSVPLAEVFEAATQIKMGTVMVFLDCCHAALEPNPFMDPDAIFGKGSVKVFVLGACSADGETVCGVFTSALIGAWRSAPRSACWRPLDLANAVSNNLVKSVGTNLIYPNVSVGRGLTRCLANLGGPSTLVFLNFTNGCRELVRVAVNGQDLAEPYDPSREGRCFFSLLVSKGTNRINIYKMDGNSPPVWSKELTPKDVADDVVVLPVGFGNTLAGGGCDQWGNYMGMAQQARSYGVQPAEVYLAVLNSAVDSENQVLLASAASGATSVFGAVLQRSPSLNWSQEELAAAAEDPSIAVNVLKAFEEAGAYTNAAVFAQGVADVANSDSVQSFAAYKYLLNARLADSESLPLKFLGKFSAQQERFVGALLAEPKWWLRERRGEMPNTPEGWMIVDEFPRKNPTIYVGSAGPFATNAAHNTAYTTGSLKPAGPNAIFYKALRDLLAFFKGWPSRASTVLCLGGILYAGIILTWKIRRKSGGWDRVAWLGTICVAIALSVRATVAEAEAECVGYEIAAAAVAWACTGWELLTREGDQRRGASKKLKVKSPLKQQQKWRVRKRR